MLSRRRHRRRRRRHRRRRRRRRRRRHHRVTVPVDPPGQSPSQVAPRPSCRFTIGLPTYSSTTIYYSTNPFVCNHMDFIT